MPKNLSHTTSSLHDRTGRHVLEGIERYYIRLAQLGIKVSKELAIDRLVEVAHENSYDPVRSYLEHCAETVEPTYIDRLATTYLIPSDSSKTEPTLYDSMLKCTLIAAVRRVFEPGPPPSLCPDGSAGRTEIIVLLKALGATFSPTHFTSSQKMTSCLASQLDHGMG